MISTNSLDCRVNGPYGLKSRLSYFDLNKSVIFQCLEEQIKFAEFVTVISHKTLDYKGNDNVILIGLCLPGVI